MDLSELGKGLLGNRLWTLNPAALADRGPLHLKKSVSTFFRNSGRVAGQSAYVA